MDFEKRIAAIYQDCRRPDQIRTAFDALQLELSFEISEAMTDTRRKLLENFDDEVREKLRVRDTESRESLSQFEWKLMELARHELSGHASFRDDSGFDLVSQPWPDGEGIPLGRYELPRRSGDAHFFRLSHPLADGIVARALARQLQPAEVDLLYSSHPGKISALEPLRGTSGWLSVSSYTAESPEQGEDHIILTAVNDQEQPLEPEASRRLLALPGIVRHHLLPGAPPEALSHLVREQMAGIRHSISERNARFFDQEVMKLDAWAEDLKTGLEREIKEIDRLIREAKKNAAMASTLEAKVAAQRGVKELESRRASRRRALFEEQDRIDAERDKLIRRTEGRLRLETNNLQELFCIRWTLK